MFIIVLINVNRYHIPFTISLPFFTIYDNMLSFTAIDHKWSMVIIIIIGIGTYHSTIG